MYSYIQSSGEYVDNSERCAQKDNPYDIAVGVIKDHLLQLTYIAEEVCRS